MTTPHPANTISNTTTIADLQAELNMRYIDIVALQSLIVVVRIDLGPEMLDQKYGVMPLEELLESGYEEAMEIVRILKGLKLQELEKREAQEVEEAERRGG